MPKISDSSTVKIHNKRYYSTLIPKHWAEDVLGLRIDEPKQQLQWRLEKGKVVVEKKK